MIFVKRAVDVTFERSEVDEDANTMAALVVQGINDAGGASTAVHSTQKLRAHAVRRTGKLCDDDVFLNANGRQCCTHDGAVQASTRAEAEEVKDVEEAIEGQPRWRGCVEVFHERLYRSYGPITFRKPADELLQLLTFTVRENVQSRKELGVVVRGTPYHGLF